MKYLHSLLAALLTVMGATTATARSRDIPTDRDPSGARSVVSLLRPANPQTSDADIATTGANAPSSSDKSTGSPKLPVASAIQVLAAIKSTNKRTHKASKPIKSSLQRHIAEIKAMAKDFMSLSIYERAILIIKHFETLHQPRHAPYYGYGHRQLPGETFPKHRALTEVEADALLRKDFNKFCVMYRHMGRDSIICAALAYNCGPGVVNRSTFYKKLKSGDRDIATSYVAHCRYKGKWHKGLHTRRLMEFAILFIP